jgi:hypothetical protein
MIISPKTETATEEYPDTVAIVRAGDNVVINVVVADYTDERLMVDINLLTPEVTQVLPCRVYGAAQVGSVWDGLQFRPPRPTNLASWRYEPVQNQWVPPIPLPQDGKKYNWNEESMSWIELTAEEIADIESQRSS